MIHVIISLYNNAYTSQNPSGISRPDSELHVNLRYLHISHTYNIIMIPQEGSIGAVRAGCVGQLPRGGLEDDGCKESMLGESTVTTISSPVDSLLELPSSATALGCSCRPSARDGADFLFITLEPSDLTESRRRVVVVDAPEGSLGYDALCFWFAST